MNTQQFGKMLFFSKIFHYFCFICFIVICFCGWRISKKFGLVTLDQIIFHMIAPKEGMDRQLYLWGIRYASVTLLLAVSYAFMLFSKRVALKARISGSVTVNFFIGIIFLAVSVCYAHVKFDAISYVFDGESTFIQDNYVGCSPDEVVFQKKQNAVIIILESMESCYGDERIFGADLIPRLSELRKRGMSFRNHMQVYGTGWTVAGLTSYLFGMPLLLFKNQGNVIFHKYMQHADSILEILERHGYAIEYVLSGAAAFAGTDSLFATHSHALIQDSKHVERIEGKRFDEYWGMPDSHTYEWARERYRELSKSGRPFVLIVQTLDTHGPDGRLSMSDDHGRGFIDVLEAADRMASNFVEWLQRQSGSGGTTIILLGDHLTGKNPLYDKYLVPHDGQRRIYNAFINPCRQVPRRDRACSSFDMAPTILESIGCELPHHKLGLGVSLFSDQKTLLERHGKEKLDAILKKKSDFYKRLFIRKGDHEQ